MTVRWKPLMILSGLFLVVALVGVIAITVAMLPKSAEGIVKVAQAARKAGRFPEAEIYYKQALQLKPRDAIIHEEFAAMYGSWMGQADAEKRAALRAERLQHLSQATRYDAGAKAPRRELLHDAMDQDLAFDSVYWAKQVLNVAPDDLDAHYVLAAEGLEDRAPNIPEIERHLQALEKGKASAARRLWVRARLADLAGDRSGRAAALAEARALPPADGQADAVDRFARLRLTALEIRSEAEVGSQALAGPVARLSEQVKALGKPEDLAPERVARLRSLLEQTQMTLAIRAAKLPPEGQKALNAQADAIEVDLERVFQQALAEGRQPDLQMYYSYAAHLRLRRQPDKGLEIVERGLKSPQAAKKTAVMPVLGLHRVAIDLILSKSDDASRFDKAAPHVQALLDSADPRSQAIGHLVAGSIDLDRSGIAREMAGDDGAAGPATQPKLRASALNHLKLAAAGLPEDAEAQAKYGVALVLAQEQNLGRQYLQNAMRLGGLEPQYQLWAAWTILQAGYPEEAEPIVQSMFGQIEQGLLSREIEGTLHLLSGELHQARRSPEDLRKAVEEFDRARAAGQAVTPTAIIRLAQVDVQLGRYDSALKRLDEVRAQGKGGAAAEQLVVLTLEEKGDKDAARSLLKKARAQYPRSSELVVVEAALMVKDGKPKEADAVLERFLRSEPENQNLVMYRAQIQVENLKAPDRARELLKGIADRSESSAPMVQLFAIELDQGRIDEAASVAGQVRARWKDSATADVLDAQVALRRNKPDKAIEHFNAALQKDPGNKIVQYWKAELDRRNGSPAEAAKALEGILRDKPVKEVEAGTSLQSAAQSALAAMSLQARDFDDAIRRFEELKRSSGTGTLSRTDRWKLITAYVNKNQWPLAKREIAAILNDAKTPPTSEERVRGANLYRQQGENAAALAQIDYVLQVDPTNPAAVVTRSYILLEEKQPAQAATILRTAISQTGKGGQSKAPAVFYLMLAVAESATTASPADGLPRTLAVIDEGLRVHPTAQELVQARYLALVDARQVDDALAFLESKVQEDPKGPLRRLLVEKLRDHKKYDRAEKLLVELHKEFPDESNVAAALVQVVSLQAAEAAATGQADRQRQLQDRAESMIREYRGRYPKDTSFLQAECDMAARRGDLPQAIALTREIDKVAKGSTLGALLRVRLFTMMGRLDEVAGAYGEAIERERGERQLEYRILLGQVRLGMGDADEAVRQADMVLAVDKKRVDATILRARGLAGTGATPGEKAARRADAVATLREILKRYPSRRDAYQSLVEIHLAAGERAAAVAALKEDLKAFPTDAAAAGQLVQVLAQPAGGDKAPADADLAEARRIADEVAGRDPKGPMVLAVAVGFQRAGQYELALPLARQAAAKLDTTAAHLALGDLLLAIAESQPAGTIATRTFAEAVAEYDWVLKKVPDSVEAVNNKAWILHTYLKQTEEALKLAAGLQKRAIPAALPAEFFDTLGSIQQSVGQSRDAEASYLEGLKKDPKNPTLNLHYGKLLIADGSRAGKARIYLDKAAAERDRLSPAMAREAESLLKGLSGSIRGN